MRCGHTELGLLVADGLIRHARCSAHATHVEGNAREDRLEGLLGRAELDRVGAPHSDDDGRGLVARQRLLRVGGGLRTEQ